MSFPVFIGINGQSARGAVRGRGSPEALPCWQIWQWVTDDLTTSQNSVVNTPQLQGKAPCQSRPRPSAPVSVDENYIKSHTISVPIHSGRPPLPTLRAQGTSLTERQTRKDQYHQGSHRDEAGQRKRDAHPTSWIPRPRSDHRVCKSKGRCSPSDHGRDGVEVVPFDQNGGIHTRQKSPS